MDILAETKVCDNSTETEELAARALFDRLTGRRGWGIFSGRERYASLHTLHLARQFDAAFPHWAVQYMWETRFVTFTAPLGASSGSCSIQRNGRPARTYSLTEASFQRLRRYWNEVIDREDREILAIGGGIYLMVV